MRYISAASSSTAPGQSLPRLTLPVVLLSLALLWPVLAVAPATAQPESRTLDGDPATTERINAGDPADAALAVSAARFVDAAGQGRTAAHAVVATTESFADSLAGAALTTDGPLLLTSPTALSANTAAELTRTLAPGDTVYALGGIAALGEQVATDIRALGFIVVRLAGETRVETALVVADEVRRLSPSTTVLLARSDGAPGNPTSAFADSMTGGSLAAYARIPIIVTPTDALHPAVAAWLSDNAPTQTVLLGGQAALARAVFDAVPNPIRLSGPERTATAAAIAGSPLWGSRDSRQFVILDGGRADAWAYGLSAAGLAADAGAPPLMVVTSVTAETRRLVSTCGPAEVDLVLIGDASVITDAIEAALTTFDGQACTADFAALHTFADCTTTRDYFVEEALARVGPYGLDGYYYGAPDVFIDTPTEDDATTGGTPPPPPPAPPPPAAAPAPGDGASNEAAPNTDVSQTNVQEIGVDEPDLVKTNGQAAYIVNGQGVEVMGLTAGGPATFVRTLNAPGGSYSQELLLNDDVLLVLGRGDGYAMPVDSPPESTSFAPPYYFPDPTTHLSRFDVSDPTNPVLVDSTTIDGEYRSARMVEGTVRIVTSSNPTGLEFVFPQDGSQEATDAALARNVEVIRNSTLDNWLPMVGEGEDARPALDCGDIFAPPDFSGISTVLVTTMDVATSVQPTSSAAVVAQAETVYASPDRLVVSTSQWGSWNDDVPEAVTTELHSFDISDREATTYVGSGQVPGYVLNSFALSERDGYYRVATTTQPPWRNDDGPQGTTDNGITILTEGGSELFESGRVFGLGGGETIFAVRYLGDIAAVVTFRQTDPLYLVDLTNPAAPRVTGELKIPGVSRYLHPLDSDHLLGVGQDGDDDGRLTGLQISLFDISDRGNPTRVDSVEFGPGDSPVEYDHKAFLFWSPLQRALVPSNLYSQEFRSGVQAVDVSVEDNTLTLVGEARQASTEQSSVNRTFIADGTLYSVSYSGVGSHDLQSLANQGFTAFPQSPGGCCVALEEPPGPPQ